MQLNKFVARSGAAARRKAALFIKNRRVTVNGEIITEPGHQVAPGKDLVRLDGIKLAITAKFIYLLLNKPAGTITAVEDGRGRNTVTGLIGSSERIFPAGRLDFDTTGVLLLTNDGELVYRLTHPRFGVSKIYRADVRGGFTSRHAEALAAGVEIEPGVTVRGDVTIIRSSPEASTVEITLHEGRKHQVKKMMLAVNRPVYRLERICFAGLTSAGLQPGEWRELSRQEIEQLYTSVGMDT